MEDWRLDSPEVVGDIVRVATYFLYHVEVVLLDLAPHAQNDLPGLEDEHVVAGLEGGSTAVSAIDFVQNHSVYRSKDGL